MVEALQGKLVPLPLYDLPDYSYSCSLQGESYILRFIYNTRMKLYTLYLYDLDRTPIIEGVALVPNYPVMADYAISGLTGRFIMFPKEDIESLPYQQYPESLSKYYYLIYFHKDT